jgi:hypothetical protein
MNILRASAYVRALSGAFLFGLSSGGIVIAADVSRASSDTVVVTASRLPE